MQNEELNMKIELRKYTPTKSGNNMITDVVELVPTERGTKIAFNFCLVEWAEWKYCEISKDIYDVANSYIAEGYKLYHIE